MANSLPPAILANFLPPYWMEILPGRGNILGERHVGRLTTSWQTGLDRYLLCCCRFDASLLTECPSKHSTGIEHSIDDDSENKLAWAAV
jgi:hypothetical protein